MKTFNANKDPFSTLRGVPGDVMGAFCKMNDFELMIEVLGDPRRSVTLAPSTEPVELAAKKPSIHDAKKVKKSSDCAV